MGLGGRDDLESDGFGNGALVSIEIIGNHEKYEWREMKRESEEKRYWMLFSWWEKMRVMYMI